MRGQRPALTPKEFGTLRRKLGQGSIETVVGRGYRPPEPAR
ncbi:hypothetical protein [Nonomuraea basaltis]|nr:hypothetical protein [Nonomuraea basaltis]